MFVSIWIHDKVNLIHTAAIRIVPVTACILFKNTTVESLNIGNMFVSFWTQNRVNLIHTAAIIGVYWSQ